MGCALELPAPETLLSLSHFYLVFCHSNETSDLSQWVALFKASQESELLCLKTGQRCLILRKPPFPSEAGFLLVSN